MEGTRPGEDRNRFGSDGSCKPRRGGIAGSHQKLRRGKEEIFHQSLEGEWPCQHRDFGLLRTVRAYISVVLSYPVCGYLLQQPQETNTTYTGNPT